MSGGGGWRAVRHCALVPAARSAPMLVRARCDRHGPGLFRGSEGGV